MFEAGQEVVILMGAFPGSPEERDKYARGKTGTIEHIENNGEWFCEVSLREPFSPEDSNIYLVLDTEIVEAV